MPVLPAPPPAPPSRLLRTAPPRAVLVRRRSTRVLPAALLSTVLLSSVLLAGCSPGSPDAATSSSSSAGAVDESAAEGSSGGGSGERTRGGQGVAAPDSPEGTPGGPELVDLRAAPGAAVIRTADLEVRVDDVRAAADEAARVVGAAGGVLEAEERTGAGDATSATVRLRVPPAAFDATVADLAALGDERSRRLGSDDVTDEVVDLEARLATQRASVERVRALLGQAKAIGEVVQIESELTSRTAELEALQARLEALEAQVDLSTIVLRLDSEGGPVVGPALGFGDGLRAGWSAVTTAARVVAVSSGALLPFLPLLLAGALVAHRLRGGRATRRPLPVDQTAASA